MSLGFQTLVQPVDLLDIADAKHDSLPELQTGIVSGHQRCCAIFREGIVSVMHQTLQRKIGGF